MKSEDRRIRRMSATVTRPAIKYSGRSLGPRRYAAWAPADVPTGNYRKARVIVWG